MQTTSPVSSPAVKEIPARQRLTPERCRTALAVGLFVWVLGNVAYLHWLCPYDLSGDEAHYWDWSTRLDLSYYSKGPLVAYLIRASCALSGDTMQAVRYPAVLCSAGTLLLTYLTARRLFASDRLALGATALLAAVPVLLVGSVLMTIDPPMLLAWAAATYFAVLAVFDGKRWAWVAVGVALGIGFLAKYSALLWYVGLLGFLLTDGAPSSRFLQGRFPEDRGARDGEASGPVRPRLRGLFVALAVSLLFTLPVLWWNHANGWVSFRHVAKQTGAAAHGVLWGSPFEMLGTQLAAAGPGAAALMLGGVVYAFSRHSLADPHRRGLRLLAWVGVSFFALSFAISFRTKVQGNWPSPAYVTLAVVAAAFAARSARGGGPWRAALNVAIWTPLVVLVASRNTSVFYPLANLLMTPDPQLGGVVVRNADPTAKVRGWRELGAHLDEWMTKLGPAAFVLCEDYQQTAETRFYMTGHPRTFYAGSYFTGQRQKRLSQYDLWPDAGLDQPALRGKSAVFVGYPTPDVERAFERWERLPELVIRDRGVVVRTFKLSRGDGFKGMTRPGEGRKY